MRHVPGYIWGMTSTGTEPDTTPVPPAPGGATVLAPPAPRRPRWGRWLALVAVLVVLGGLTLAIAAGVSAARNLFPDLLAPFTAEPERIDRSGPAVLSAIEELSEYRAATGHYEVIVDVEEDVPGMPSFLRGERTIFVAAGTVDGVVDLSDLGAGAVSVNEDRTSVTVSLPSATLSDAAVDPERSYVYGRERGLLDRLGSLFSDSPTGERELYLLAEQRLEAAAQEGSLTASAETNTRSMLESLLRSLGFTDVRVDFS